MDPSRLEGFGRGPGGVNELATAEKKDSWEDWHLESTIAVVRLRAEYKWINCESTIKEKECIIEWLCPLPGP